MSGPFASRVAVADRLRPFAASDELGNLLPDAEAINSAAEAAFDLLELAPWPELEDAALEAIASLQTERAFRCLLGKATRIARSNTRLCS